LCPDGVVRGAIERLKVRFLAARAIVCNCRWY
jgi:hypothetical protein